MEKKQGDICIVTKDLFIKDDNHPNGFIIPVNTRLIIDTLSENYFCCTLDSGYKTGIEFEYKHNLVIITDNKKINKFKQQLAENIQNQNEPIINVEFNRPIIKEPKTVTKRKVYNIEVLEFSDGSSEMNRTNDGFNINELMGLSSLISYEMLDTYRGIIKPDIIHRTAIID